MYGNEIPARFSFRDGRSRGLNLKIKGNYIHVNVASIIVTRTPIGQLHGVII
jgi:hypothetical protein